jgi:hypothetical protein
MCVRRCGRCREASYCGPACQKAAYPAHREACRSSSKLQRAQARQRDVTDRPDEPGNIDAVTNVVWEHDRALQWIDTEGNASQYEEEGQGMTRRDASDDVIYPYPDFVFAKQRQCYCYTMGGNAQKDCTLIITASDAAIGVTVLPPNRSGAPSFFFFS